MRSLILLAGLVSLSLTIPAEAKPGNGQGGNAKREHAGHKGGKASTAKHGKTTTLRDRTRYDRTRSDRYDRTRSSARDGSSCPPGLAAKNNGCLPPGQAKKRFAVGDRLPSSYGSYNIPADYRDRYRDTTDDLYRYNDGNVYRIRR